MNININSHELTSEVVMLEDLGMSYPFYAARLMLQSSPLLNNTLEGNGDERNAITFWLPKTQGKREAMAQAFERIAEIFRTAP